MIDIFWLKLILSFIVGAVWVTTATIIAERKGTKIGGLIVGLPSTIVISLFFIAWTQSTNAAAQAVVIVPVVGGINALFLVVYMALVRVNFWLSIIAAFGTWAVPSLLLIKIGFDSLLVSIISFIVLVFISYYIMENIFKVKSEKGKKTRLTVPSVMLRGLFTGSVISFAVFMSKAGGPLWGGAFSMFPAMFFGALMVTYFSHGASFSSAVLKISLISAISVVVHGLAVMYTYPAFGIWFGTLYALIISFTSAFLINYFIIRRMS